MTIQQQIIRPVHDLPLLQCDGILQQVWILTFWLIDCREHIVTRYFIIWDTRHILHFLANCVKGSGRYYHGYVNKTQSGIPCAAWFSKEPHEQSSPPNNIFPEMRNSQNHCRNPGGTESSPWCYTTDVSVRWQYCDIPKCGKHSQRSRLLMFNRPALVYHFIEMRVSITF